MCRSVRIERIDNRGIRSVKCVSRFVSRMDMTGAVTCKECTKSVTHVQSYCLANLNVLRFCRSRCRPHRCCLSSLLAVTKMQRKLGKNWFPALSERT